jgi:hypothetical protein
MHRLTDGLGRAAPCRTLERSMTNQSDAIAMEWVEIVRGEYVEMPGLRLTQREARRLWGLDDGVCARVLKALVDERFLRITGDGRYVRAVLQDVLRDQRHRKAAIGGSSTISGDAA